MKLRLLTFVTCDYVELAHVNYIWGVAAHIYPAVIMCYVLREVLMCYERFMSLRTWNFNALIWAAVLGPAQPSPEPGTSQGLGNLALRVTSSVSVTIPIRTTEAGQS